MYDIIEYEYVIDDIRYISLHQTTCRTFISGQKSICQCLVHLIHFLLLSLFQLLLFPQLNLLHKLAAMPGHFIHLSGMDFGRSDATSKDALAQLAKPFRFELATPTFSCPPVPIFLSSTILGFPPCFLQQTLWILSSAILQILLQ